MEKTYTSDQLRRMRAAYDTIDELESLKHDAVTNGSSDRRLRRINELIEHWYATVEAIKSEE